MLRTTGFSLLLGAAALFAVLRLVYLPAGSGAPETLVWDSAQQEQTSAASKAAPHNRDKTVLTLNQYGWGVVEFAHTDFPANAYAHLHLALEDFDREADIAVAWQSDSAPQEQRRYTLENESRESVWISTAELRGWDGSISNFQLFIIGEPGASIQIIDFSLHSPNSISQLRALYSDLAGFVPWNRSSMNSHSGATKVSSFYPALLFFGYLVLSLGSYLLLLLIRRSANPDWAIIGAIFLAVWIMLDMFWQKRLTDQLSVTRADFAGKTTEEKLAVGPDAQLFNFIRSIRPHIEQPNSRIFVASSDDYTGLRGAYYLYPLNVFWTLHGEEIPKNYFLRSGDYIALLNPYSVDYNRAEGTVTAPRGILNIETVLATRAGRLLRVN